MKFIQLTDKLVLSVMLAIAAGLPAAAATKYDFMTQSVVLQTPLPQCQAQSLTVSPVRQTAFNHPPQLMRTAASQTSAYMPSTYEFTLTVPPDAGQSLQAVAIAQVENLETIKFDISNSHVLIGKRLTASSEIRLANIGGNLPAKPGEVTIVFDQPTSPSSTVTATSAAHQNPNWAHVYLFGITAYPTGENRLGQFLGYGRINF
jgi:hypothetical protein